MVELPEVEEEDEPPLFDPPPVVLVVPLVALVVANSPGLWYANIQY